jgi:general secretion pathway protein G
MQLRRCHAGFSYIELVISVAILALLATAATPYLENTITRQKEMELRKNLREIRTGIDAYKKAFEEGRITQTVGDSGYPKKLEALISGIPDDTDPQKKKMYFMRKIPADPMYQGNSDNPEDTWGKRSYDSDADNPREGADVFDVYSMSNEKGLNGIPYRLW